MTMGNYNVVGVTFKKNKRKRDSVVTLQRCAGVAMLLVAVFTCLLVELNTPTLQNVTLLLTIMGVLFGICDERLF